jgi:Outer membrane protein beta-barrel domain
VHRIPSLILLFAASAISTDLSAQSAQPISIQLSGLYNGVYGDVFTGLQNGFGAEGQLRYTPGALSIGAGFQYTNHGLKNQPENIHFYGGFLEPRYRIHTGSYVVAPYVSARLSLLKAAFSGGDLSLSSSFIQVNGGGGILYRVGPRVNLDVGATYGYNRLGSGTLRRKSNNTELPIQSGSGTNLIIRLGFAVGIGG